MKDIREYKKSLRERYKNYRIKLKPLEKQELDSKILDKLVRLNQYVTAQLLLIYVSTDIEVDTKELIVRAFKDGKRVGVPRCVPGTRQMEFYEIHSLAELEPGSFGVLEPIPSQERLLPTDPGGLCIVPGLCFDNDGYRLGYGKGYYDRFLSGYSGATVGICYSFCIRGNLIHGRYDCAVDLLVTDRFVRRTTRKQFWNQSFRMRRNQDGTP